MLNTCGLHRRKNNHKVFLGAVALYMVLTLWGCSSDRDEKLVDHLDVNIVLKNGAEIDYSEESFISGTGSSIPFETEFLRDESDLFYVAMNSACKLAEFILQSQENREIIYSQSSNDSPSKSSSISQKAIRIKGSATLGFKDVKGSQVIVCGASDNDSVKCSIGDAGDKVQVQYHMKFRDFLIDSFGPFNSFTYINYGWQREGYLLFNSLKTVSVSEEGLTCETSLRETRGDSVSFRL